MEEIIIYGPKTLTTGWFLNKLAEPKDHNPYTDKVKNLFISTYNHLGTDQTDYVKRKDDQIQTNKKPTLNVHRSLVNLVSYPTTLGKERKKYSVKFDNKRINDQCDRINYTTEMKDQYRSFMPRKLKNVDITENYKQEIKFRKLLVDGSCARRPGLNKFYDDNMAYLEQKMKTTIFSQPPYVIHDDV